MSDPNPSSKSTTWPYLIAALLSLVGLGDAIYLTIQDLTGQNLRCTIISGCAEVLGSKYAHVAGIPLASLGALAYFLVFSLAILVLFGYGFARPALAILIGIMFLTSLWLLYLQAFVIHHFCQYCLLSAAVTTLLAIIVFASRIANRRVAAS
ncbi:MAG TPA: vitamin K epoxide reductase family protein [Pyrinomonadaceae bacterium]|nr:vitamin K epoxide reductase family protein [Pyrinomonadaceae bacterium]